MKEGFFGTIGSFGAMALFGIIIMLGIWLVMLGKADPAKKKDSNAMLMSVGIALVILGSLPLLPFLGITFLSSLFE